MPATGAMMNKPALIGWAAGIKSLLKCIENEVGLGRLRCFPADDPVGEGVDHEGYVNEALPC